MRDDFPIAVEDLKRVIRIANPGIKSLTNVKIMLQSLNWLLIGNDAFFLTMRRIIIGVAAVIILVSLVNGYMGTIVENFASMGVNQINVSMKSNPGIEL